jgi:hypothetical protein
MMQNSKYPPIEPTEYVARCKAFEESLKLRYDGFKHLTTLSTGAILINVALLEKLFTTPKWKILVGAAFLSFLISVVLSFFLMNSSASYIRDMLNYDLRDLAADKEMNLIEKFVSICIGCFVLGLVCL